MQHAQPYQNWTPSRDSRNTKSHNQCSFFPKDEVLKYITQGALATTSLSNMVGHGSPWEKIHPASRRSQGMQMSGPHVAEMLLILPMAGWCSDGLGHHWLISPPFFWKDLKLGFGHIQLNLHNITLLACSLLFFPSDALHDCHTCRRDYVAHLTTQMAPSSLEWEIKSYSEIFFSFWLAASLHWVLQEVTYPKSPSWWEAALGMGWNLPVHSMCLPQTLHNLQQTCKGERE